MKTIGIVFFTSLIIFIVLILFTSGCAYWGEQLVSRDYFIRKHAPSEDAFVSMQRIAEPYISKGQWKEAVEICSTYSPLFEPMDNRFEKIIELLLAEETNLMVTNLGRGINTKADEYLPAPSADGNYLYFTGDKRTGGYGKEDIFVSQFQIDEWKEAVSLSTPINTFAPEAVVSISTDGNRLVLFGYYKGNLGQGDLYYVDRTTDGWGEVKHFPEPLNSKYFDSNGQITSDGKAILFTSERPGGIGEFYPKGKFYHGDYWGNQDIYVSELTDDGWSNPINLGPTINTPFAEYSPFLHPDGKTLYFSSDGHYGLGRLDVFKSVRLREDSWTEWSDPINLGKEINTPGNDWGYKISTSGDVAFFSADIKNKGYGGLDIYSISLPQEAKPEQVATIKGKVLDTNGNPLNVEIKWEDLSTGENVGQSRTNPEDGSFLITLPLGKNYGYYAEKAGYYPVASNIDLETGMDSMNVSEDMVLVSIDEMKRENIPVRINNIFFDSDKYTLKEESFSELDRVAKINNDNRDHKVEILGHTDSQGSNEYNLTLSEKRAQSVVNYLISAGGDSARLIPNGYGESIPVASNDTEEGRALNRRVEFRFISEEKIKQ